MEARLEGLSASLGALLPLSLVRESSVSSWGSSPELSLPPLPCGALRLDILATSRFRLD